MSLTRTMKEYKALEPGTYEVELMDLVETQLENPQNGTGDVIRFVLECTDVMDTDGTPYKLDGIANDVLTPMSKLTEWLRAFGVVAEPGGMVDMAQAIGRKAMCTTINKPGKDGTGSFTRIDKLVPLPKSRAAAPRPSAEPAEPAEPAASAASVEETHDVLDISAWWKVTRDRNWKRDDVLKLSHEMYGCEPAELAPEDRDVLLEAVDQR